MFPECSLNAPRQVNISAATVAWEHEQFAKRKLIAGTLSARRAPLASPGFSSLADRGARAVNATSVVRAVRLVSPGNIESTLGNIQSTLRNIHSTVFPMSVEEDDPRMVGRPLAEDATLGSRRI
jgi:phosphopantetheine adenylyltransferase